MTLAIAADRRRIEAEPDERAHAAVLDVAPRLVAVRVEAARAMVRVETTRTYVAHQCASIEEYGVRFLGVSPREARDLADLGRALDAEPTAAVVAAIESARAADAGVGDAGAGTAAAGAASSGTIVAATPGTRDAASAVTVAHAVLAGALSVERAVAAGQFLRKPDLLRDGEDPVALATAGPMRLVRSTLRSREEELAQREAVVPLPLSVTARARDDFRRAKALASERAGAMLTDGQTFTLVVHHWLEDFDPLRGGEGARRLTDTAGLPGRRYVPHSVRRAVIRRSGGQCEIPGCTRRTFLALAHDCAHAAGGSREEANLWHACRCHHLQFDAGLIRICGWKDGRPTFCDAEGRLLEDRARIVPPCPAAFGADDGSRDAEDAVATPPAECPAAVDPPDALETAAESQGDEAPADDRRHREQATRHAIAAAPEAYPGTRSNRDRPREPQRRVRSARPRPGADRTPAPRQAAAATQRGGRRAARWSGVRRAAGSSEPAPAGTPSQGGPLPRNRAVLRIQRRSRGEPSQDEHLHERPPPHPPD